MTDGTVDSEILLERARAGDESALAELFLRHRDALKRMVRLRMDERLARRVDASDVIQDAYFDVRARFAEYAATRPVPFFIWARQLTLQRLIDVQRHHLVAKARAADREVALGGGSDGEAPSASLADLIIGGLTTPTEAAYRAELKGLLLDTLARMDPMDREVLALRHFELLTNEETALVLGIERAAASQRYFRALKRMRDVLSSSPGFREDG